jgi:ferredoxin
MTDSPEHAKKIMTVWVDEDQCYGSKICWNVGKKEKNKLFGPGPDKFTRTQQHGVTMPTGLAGIIDVPPELETAVEEVADMCPGQCINIGSRTVSLVTKVGDTSIPAEGI